MRCILQIKQINTGNKPRDSLRKLGRSFSKKIESKDDDTRFEPTDADVADDDKNDDDDDDDDEGQNECFSILL
jgi:hypothetical protein